MNAKPLTFAFLPKLPAGVPWRPEGQGSSPRSTRAAGTCSCQKLRRPPGFPTFHAFLSLPAPSTRPCSPAPADWHTAPRPSVLAENSEKSQPHLHYPSIIPPPPPLPPHHPSLTLPTKLHRLMSRLASLRLRSTSPIRPRDAAEQVERDREGC